MGLGMEVIRASIRLRNWLLLVMLRLRWVLVSLAGTVLLYRRLCRGMNRAERFVNANALLLDAGARAPAGQREQAQAM